MNSQVDLEKRKLSTKILNKINYIFFDSWKNLATLIFFLILIFLIFSGLLVNSSSDRSTLDIINLLVQSEAAVIAIVITLSLVAVQLVASSYSTRVMEIFKKSYSFWAIVLLYISSIITGLFTLILNNNGINTFIIQKLILIDYYLGIVAFIALIPFIWITFDLLKLSTVLKKLSKNIQIEKVPVHISNKKNEDPIQPIIDIVHASCIKSDYTTFTEGLNEIDNIFSLLLDDSESNQEEILNYILEHFRRISVLTMNNQDEDATWEIVNRIYKIGMETAINKNIIGTRDALRVLGEIGKVTAQKYEHITMVIADFITDINLIMMEEMMDELFNIPIGYLGDIGKIAVEYRFQYPPDSISQNIERISMEAIKKNLEPMIINSIFALRTIGKAALKHDLDMLTFNIVTILGNIGKLARIKNERSIILAIQVLGDIKNTALDYKNEIILEMIAKSVAMIVESTDGTKNESIIRYGILLLTEMGKRSIEYELETTILTVIESLTIIGQISVDQKMKKSIKDIINLLMKYTQIEEIDYVSNAALTAINIISKSAIRNKSEDLIIDLIETFRKIGEISFKEENEERRKSIIINIREIGIAAAKQGFDNSVQNSSRSIEELLKISIDKNFDDITRMGISALYMIGKIVTNNKMEYSVLETVESIGNIGKILVKNKQNLIALQSIKSLEKIKEIANKYDMHSVSLKIDNYNHIILECAKKNNLEDIILYLNKIKK